MIFVKGCVAVCGRLPAVIGRRESERMRDGREVVSRQASLRWRFGIAYHLTDQVGHGHAMIELSVVEHSVFDNDMSSNRRVLPSSKSLLCQTSVNWKNCSTPTCSCWGSKNRDIPSTACPVETKETTLSFSNVALSE